MFEFPRCWHLAHLTSHVLVVTKQMTPTPRGSYVCDVRFAYLLKMTMVG